MDDQTTKLLYDLFDSLKRELKQDLQQELQPVKDALERIETRLNRQGGLIQGGARQISRLATWSEDIDEQLADRDRRIEELARRVRKLENGKPSEPAT